MRRVTLKIRKGIANPRPGSPLPRLTRQAARQSRLEKSETLFKSLLLRTLSFASEKPTSFYLRFQTLDLVMTGNIFAANQIIRFVCRRGKHIFNMSRRFHRGMVEQYKGRKVYFWIWNDFVRNILYFQLQAKIVKVYRKVFLCLLRTRSGTARRWRSLFQEPFLSQLLGEWCKCSYFTARASFWKIEMTYMHK